MKVVDLRHGLQFRFRVWFHPKLFTRSLLCPFLPSGFFQGRGLNYIHATLRRIQKGAAWLRNGIARVCKRPRAFREPDCICRAMYGATIRRKEKEAFGMYLYCGGKAFAQTVQ
jgi:hypothetical protein